MKDWVIRALKTFVQAFFGVLIPAVCTMLQNGWPESWSKIWVVLAPTVAAALAAAICAVWNIILEALDTKANSEIKYTGDNPPDITASAGKHEINASYRSQNQQWRDEQ